MATPSNDPTRPFLVGDAALDWFLQRRGGGTILDMHYTVLADIFGQDTPIQLRAAIDPASGRPTVLIFDIMKPPDDDESWRKLLVLQERLLEYEADLKERSRTEAPYGRIVVSLGGSPANWDGLLRDVEGNE